MALSKEGLLDKIAKLTPENEIEKRKKRRLEQNKKSFLRSPPVATAPAAIGYDKESVTKTQPSKATAQIAAPPTAPSNNNAATALNKSLSKLTEDFGAKAAGAKFANYGKVTDSATGNSITYENGKFSSPTKDIPRIKIPSATKDITKALPAKTVNPTISSARSAQQSKGANFVGLSDKIGWHERTAYNKEILRNRGAQRIAQTRANTQLDLQENNLRSTTTSQAAAINNTRAKTKLANQEIAQGPARSKLADLRVKLTEQYINGEEQSKKKKPSAGLDLNKYYGEL